jgi:glutathione S-transferase
MNGNYESTINRGALNIIPPLSNEVFIMKLYYAPGACSLAPHIVLREAGLDFQLEKVDLGTKTTESGENFLEINHKGYVPALRLDNGEILTEASVTLQYIADQSPDAGLIPAQGDFARYRLLENLNFVSTEIHKTLGAFFNPAMTAEWREGQLALFNGKASYLESRFSESEFLMGDEFSVADAYLFAVLGWTGLHGIDMEPYPNIRDYIGRIQTRPAVIEAMVAEGLLPADAGYQKAS